MNTENAKELIKGFCFPVIPPTGIPGPTWTAFTSHGHYKRIEAGEVLFKENQKLTHIYVIISGYIKISKQDIAIDIVEPGQSLGAGLVKMDMSSDNDIYIIGAQALTSVELVQLTKAQLIKCLHQHPDLSLYFFSQMQTRMSFLQTMKSIQPLSVQARVAHFLILKKHLLNKIFITRKMIAEIISTTTETVIRTLTEFNKQSIIQEGKKNITIVRLNELEELCHKKKY